MAIMLSIPNTVQPNLTQAAAEIQAWLSENRGEHYRLTDLEQALIEWLELTLEELAEEALFHCCSGADQAAVGRRRFRDYLDRCTEEIRQEASQAALAESKPDAA